jgi:CubicO group peptidase (beta-lactamase class C family)
VPDGLVAITSSGVVVRTEPASNGLCRIQPLLLGSLGGVRVLQPATVALMTSVQTPPGLPRRGLGWDVDSPYAGQRGTVFPIGGYGHTGWTGPSLWIDPFSGTLVVLLSNRNHPSEEGNVLPLRREIGTLAAQAVRDFDFAAVRIKNAHRDVCDIRWE